MGTRHEVEDRLIQALEDCINDHKLLGFREWLRRDGLRIGYNPDSVALALRDDNWCWGQVLLTTCTLKRMQHRYEWAANQLMMGGLPVDAIPHGNEYLGV